MAKFSPIVIKTTNVKSELLILSKKYNIPSSEIDFNILKINTFYKTQTHSDWQFFVADDLEDIFDVDEILATTLLLKQEYEIEFIPKKIEHSFIVKMQLSADKNRTQVFAIVSPTSIIEAKKSSAQLLLQAIYKKKLLAALFIGLFEKNLKKDIMLFLHHIKDGQFNKDYKLIIANAYKPEDTIHDRVMLHFKKKEKKDNQMLNPVQKDELIMTYIKAKAGKNGRACNGELIKAEDPKIQYEGKIQIDETIRLNELEDKIEYFSIDSGYVKQNGYYFSISNDLEMSQASFRGTGHIESGSEKDVNVMIQKQKNCEDSVGSGVRIDVNKLDVEGTVGSHTTIKANELNIGEQTHKKAVLEVTEKATVKLHRGNLKAREAEIEILETGLVEAEEVIVDKMLGGEIIAKRVYINSLIANAVITASEIIEINHIQGNDNKLIIDPQKIPSYHKEVALYEEELKNCQKQEVSLKSAFIKFEKEYVEKAERLKVFQKKIVQATKAGKKPNKADMIRLHQFKKESEKRELLENEITNKEKQIFDLEKKLETLYNADLHAKIIHKSRYNGYTKIYFIDPKTSEEHYLLPETKIEEIHLVEDDEKKKKLAY